MKMNKVWKLWGIESLLLVFVIITIIISGIFMSSRIIDVKDDLAVYQGSVPVIDIQNATDEELANFNSQLSDSDNLEKSVDAFIILFLLVLLIVAIGSSFFLSWESKHHVKEKYWKLVAKWIGMNLLLILFSVVYFWIAIFVVVGLGFSDSNAAIGVVFWLWVILWSYKFMSSFAWINSKKKVLDIAKKVSLIHTGFVLIWAIYVLILKWAVEWSYNFTIGKIFMIILFILYLLFGAFIVSYEKSLYLK